jgi:glucose-6-phosphate-specific signal transduction histidine kinase
MLLVSSLAVYTVTLMLLYPQMGVWAGTVSVLPAIVAGWTFGLRGGLTVSLLLILLSLLLTRLSGETGRPVVVSDGSVIGVAVMILIGGVVGWIHDTAEKATEQLARRTQVEEDVRLQVEKLRRRN